MLIWIADIPGEISLFHLRLYTPWVWVGWFLVIVHFALPFVLLMPVSVKRNPNRVQLMALWLLICHAVDLYWLIMPHANNDGPHPALSDLAAFVGVGGIAIAFMLYRLRGRFLVPVGDPFLAPSLEYRP
jgi:hypothetical protein